MSFGRAKSSCLFLCFANQHNTFLSCFNKCPTGWVYIDAVIPPLSCSHNLGPSIVLSCQSETKSR
jgi:hypothetical protein